MQWYGRHKRDLPWRHTSDPYHIWVSEIILQQTRVDQGLAYYHRFLDRFPDIEALAIAEEEDVMKVWQGLGYYSRARNMHHAAKMICKDYQCVFPASYEEIRRLKGIGDYSASAISSIVFGEAHPVVDGNVMRVVARYAGITQPVNSVNGKAKIKTFLLQQIDPEQPGIFNQAVMELGALICKPKQPLCDQCPLNKDCFAHTHGLVAELPITNKSKPLTVRYFNYLVIFSGKGDDVHTWIRKRTGNDIWKNLYDFPLIETDREFPPDELENSEAWKHIAGHHHFLTRQVMDNPKYLLTHRELRVKFFIVQTEGYYHPEFIKIRFSDFHNYPVPRLIDNFFKKVASRPGIFSNFPD
jgi:A/G-specific adenine glycosylase